ncbi:MAG: aldehyde dehydrogenase family protein, partial [bacterium]|nr:aldehyde dehydrogenase family protein [bacterium]
MRKIDDLVAMARHAQATFELGADQARYDRAALAAAWALMEPTRNSELARMAVETTGLGNVADKITKNHRKTLGLLRDIKGQTTHGILRQIPKKGITEIARPIGVIGAVVPSTNPVATPLNNIVNALKCGNSIILSPSPKGTTCCERLLSHIHAEFDKIDLDHDLVQMVPAPSSKEKTQSLMEQVDKLVVTGSQNNVHRAYSSGTPALGVGAGNVSVIIDETADLQQAAAKIERSKTFDNSTSCSSENALIAVDAIYDDFIAQLERVGGRVLDEQNSHKLKTALLQDGHLNRAIIARDMKDILEVAQIEVTDPQTCRFLLLPSIGIGKNYPESGEKLSLVAALYRANDFAHAKTLAKDLMKHQGAGHSVGLHTSKDARAMELGMELPTCRVIVNQAHSAATGGSFENGMPFS